MSDENRRTATERIKHFLLQVIDLTALGFLEPVVRLIYGEEPRVQIRKIGRFVAVPILAFLCFVGIWAAWAPHHKTKAGEVPTPSVVSEAYTTILTFSEREDSKEEAYLLSEAERVPLLQQAEAQLLKARTTAQAADEAVAHAQEADTASKKQLTERISEQLKTHKSTYKQERKTRENALKTELGTLSSNESIARVAAFREWKSKQTRLQKSMKEDLARIRAQVNPKVQTALAQQTSCAEEVQYLSSYCDILSKSNKESKLAAIDAEILALQNSMKQADTKNRYKQADKILVLHERRKKVEASSYAKASTLPMQIIRSIACVFAGFLIGTVIAVPIGVCCGLSSTFMAAVTPFIALFKPVSPIVWLPILLIIVGGFIPDPETHWLIQWLWDAPLIGELKINPAFLASALTVAMCSLWATMVNAALGVASVDEDHLNVAKVLRLGFCARLFKIILPSSLPLIFAGMRISLGVGWMVLIAAELLASSEGIGKFVWDQFNNGASDSFAKMFVVVFVVGFVGLILDRIMIIFQRLVSFEGSVAAI